jgi:hypothetical protein
VIWVMVDGIAAYLQSSRPGAAAASEGKSINGWIDL